MLIFYLMDVNFIHFLLFWLMLMTSILLIYNGMDGVLLFSFNQMFSHNFFYTNMLVLSCYWIEHACVDSVQVRLTVVYF